MGSFFKALFGGFFSAFFSLFSKSTDEKLGIAETSNKTLAEQNTALQQELKVANQGNTPADVQKDLQGGNF